MADASAAQKAPALPPAPPSRLSRLVLSKAVEVSSSSLVKWSPNGMQLAMGKGKRLVIRSPAMDILTFFNCAGAVESVEWSADSQLVLTGAYQNQVVQAWKPADPAWRCTVTDDLGGIVEARWSPCSRMVLTLADFNLHICVWSLVDESKSFIPNPKSLTSSGLACTADGRFAAVLQRKSCKDTLGVFSVAEAWKPLRHFEVATHDAAAVSWSPTNEALCVVDTALSYLVLVYSPDGQLLKRLCAYEDALGVRSHAWSPRGNFLSVGSFDGLVRTLDNASWSVVSTVNAETISAWDSTEDGEGDGGGEGGAATVGAAAAAAAGAASGAVDDDDDAAGAPWAASTGGRALLFEEVYDHELPDVEGAQGRFVSIVSDGTAANGAHITDPDDDTVSQARTIVSSCVVCVPRLSSVAWRDLSSDVQGAQAKFQTLNAGGGGGAGTAVSVGWGKKRKGPPPLPASGVSHIAWSADGRFFAVLNARFPSVVWIWRLGRRQHSAALVLKSKVRTIRWHPRLPYLAVCTGESPRAFVWTPTGVLDVCVPSGGLVPQRLLWANTAGDDELGFCLAGVVSACTGVLTRGRDEDEDEAY